MIVSLIVAMDERGGIGKGNRLPWRLSTDLKRFRELTMGHHIIMGRKTFESIGRALPGRQTVIVTRNLDLEVEGCLIAHSLDEALQLAEQRAETEAFVCGGAEIYAWSIERADRIYLTEVHTVVEADTFFPAWDRGLWREVESVDYPADEKNQYATTYKLLEKRGGRSDD
ncbi:MAG TPA: dihydrofolate reductase [Blastocatellia bacterium]|nr:dihydrofolate reductase [Blastocatellia bacterium]